MHRRCLACDSVRCFRPTVGSRGRRAPARTRAGHWAHRRWGGQARVPRRLPFLPRSTPDRTRYHLERWTAQAPSSEPGTCGAAPHARIGSSACNRRSLSGPSSSRGDDPAHLEGRPVACARHSRADSPGLRLDLLTGRPALDRASGLHAHSCGDGPPRVLRAIRSVSAETPLRCVRRVPAPHMALALGGCRGGNCHARIHDRSGSEHVDRLLVTTRLADAQSHRQRLLLGCRLHLQRVPEGASRVPPRDLDELRPRNPGSPHAGPSSAREPPGLHVHDVAVAEFVRRGELLDLEDPKPVSGARPRVATEGAIVTCTPSETVSTVAVVGGDQRTASPAAPRTSWSTRCRPASRSIAPRARRGGTAVGPRSHSRDSPSTAASSPPTSRAR